MQKSFLRLALAMAFAASAPSFAQLQAANTALNLPLALQRAASANPELAVAQREVQTGTRRYQNQEHQPAITAH